LRHWIKVKKSEVASHDACRGRLLSDEETFLLAGAFFKSKGETMPRFYINFQNGGELVKDDVAHDCFAGSGQRKDAVCETVGGRHHHG
jgi:hypothetical protein